MDEEDVLKNTDIISDGYFQGEFIEVDVLRRVLSELEGDIKTRCLHRHGDIMWVEEEGVIDLIKEHFEPVLLDKEGGSE